MIWKSQAAITLLPIMVIAVAALVAQTGNQAKPAHPSAPPASSKSAPGAPANSSSDTPTQAAPGAANPPDSSGATPSQGNSNSPNDCQGGPCDTPTPHITIATPAPAPAPWPLQDRIAWGANLILVLVAYVGIMLGLSMVRKVERQTRYSEVAAQAAADSAKAALLYAQAQAQTDRPWILVTTEPAPEAPDSFTILAANRGRSPARIVSLTDEIVSAGEESQLPPKPVFAREPDVPTSPMILLPGEAVSIKSFRRDEVDSVCEGAEQLRRVEEWEEKIYLYGSIIYLDLRTPDEKITFETSWCCWYIHGRQKSGMVMAGPPQYNRHT